MAQGIRRHAHQHSLSEMQVSQGHCRRSKGTSSLCVTDCWLVRRRRRALRFASTDKLRRARLFGGLLCEGRESGRAAGAAFPMRCFDPTAAVLGSGGTARRRRRRAARLPAREQRTSRQICSARILRPDAGLRNSAMHSCGAPSLCAKCGRTAPRVASFLPYFISKPESRICQCAFAAFCNDVCGGREKGWFGFIFPCT